ncbi:MAG TPA: OmpA family protein [Burkholderiales bacterium]|jgi:OOP family OmpA-OmpF porin|nr:OmpA family protein [Burkholderiales bacterium]
MIKAATITAAAAVALSAFSFSAAAQESTDGYVRSAPAGVYVKSPFGACVRTGYWTPAMANSECDPDLAPKPAAAPAPSRAAPPPPPPVAPAAKPKPVAEKITFAADVLFDFDKATLKPEGKSKLDELAGKVKGINLEVVIAIGHTDSIGSDAYNQKLSVRRAESVKSYLVSKGIEPNRVYTEGKGEKQPVASNKTKEGRQKNRRVEIEVIGTRK